MKSLLYVDDNAGQQISAINSRELTEDLNLKYIFDACAQGDYFIAKAVRDIMLRSGKTGFDSILYRQEIMRDFISNRKTAEELYRRLITVLSDYDEAYRDTIPAFSRASPVAKRIKDSIKLYIILLKCVIDIKKTVNTVINTISSKNILACFQVFNDFYSDEFISDAFRQVKNIGLLTGSQSITLSARLGYGLKAGDVQIRSLAADETAIQKNRLKKNYVKLYGIAIQLQANDIRDSALFKLLRIVNDITGITYNHLKKLNISLAFYLGCSNLYNTLKDINVPVVFPSPKQHIENSMSFTGLTDMSLALQNKSCPVGSSIDCGDNMLTIVTGANQGGKSTFLRSIGIAQLMMQCGMFVSAEFFSADLRDGIFTHFCRPDVGGSENGKLDGELVSMRELVKSSGRNSMILMNESFSSASENDAVNMVSELLRAFNSLGIKTFYVTHFFNIPKRITMMNLSKTLFLTALRNEDGTRPYIIAKGLPKETSYGLDIYNEVFGGESISACKNI